MIGWLIISGLLIIGIILIPAKLDLTFTKSEGIFNLTCSTFFPGRLGINISGKDKTIFLGPLRFKTANIKKVNKKYKDKKAITLSGFFKSEIIDAELIKLVLKTVLLLYKRLSIKLQGNFEFGFEDPSVTGICYGLICSTGLLLNPSLRMLPNFQGSIFNGSISVRLRYNIIYIFYIMVKTTLSKPVRKIWVARLLGKEV